MRFLETATRALRAPDGVVPIRQASRLTGLTPRAIRFYEEQALVQSARGRAGERLFRAATIELLMDIARARSVGLSIREIREMLTLRERDEADARRYMAAICKRRLEEIETLRSQVEKTLAQVSSPCPGPERLKAVAAAAS